MSFPAVAAYHHPDKGFSQSYEHFDTDLFDQFFTFDHVDNQDLPESSSTSITPDDGLEGIYDPWDANFNFYSESSGRAAISDSELLSLEGITLETPPPQPQFHSLPTSPVPDNATLPSTSTRIVNSLSKKLKKSAANLENKLRSPIRKPTLSAKSSHNSNVPTVWKQKLESGKFDVEIEEIAPHVLPGDASITPPTINNYPPKLEQENNNFTFSPVSNTPQRLTAPPAAFQTPLSTPLLDTDHSHHRSGHASSVFPTTPQQAHQPDGWSQVPITPHVNTYRNSDESPIWWNHASTAPMAQPSPTALHFNPQRATKSLALQLQQNEISYNANDRAFIPPLPSGLSPPQTLAQLSPSQRQPPHTFPGIQHPQFHIRTRHTVPVHSPHQHHYPSPPNMQRQKLPMSSESESPSPKSFAVRKRKGGRSGSKQKVESSSSPRTSGGAGPSLGGAVDFVNFTPSDSKKILTGVAPSGSSKTKARREREAMEKRRKLSQAAVRAVRAAGGDVESLVEEGLLC